MAAMFRAGAESGAAVSVYMIIGIKTVEGAKMTAASGKGMGWRATLGLDAEEEGEGVVFAFQLTELKLSGGGEMVVEAICDDTEGGKVLQRELDESLKRRRLPSWKVLMSRTARGVGLSRLVRRMWIC